MKGKTSKSLFRLAAGVVIVMAMVDLGMCRVSPAAAHRLSSQPLQINGGLRLNHPFGVAFDERRRMLYVADSFDNRVLEVSESGAILHQWRGWRSDAFSQPGAVAVGKAGSIYVVDYGHNRIDRFASGGQPLQSWGGYGTAPGKFAAPEGLATDAAGDVYVADTINFRIQKFSASGHFLTSWPTFSGLEGPFLAPTGIGTAPDGDVYVSEVAADSDVFGNVVEASTPLHCVQRFSSGGRPLARWGAKGSLPGQFREPGEIAIDQIGQVYVADFGNDRIEQFSAEGKFQTSIGPDLGHGMRMHGPAALSLDNRGQLYVADWFNSRIDQLSPSGLIVSLWR
jgi:tripartite motif-containing protein 71